MTIKLSELSWPELPAGNRIRYIWQEWLQNHFEEYHGGYLLTLDSLTQCLSLPDNVFEHEIRLGKTLEHCVEADPEQLPFMTDSLQSVVISHALEYTENPSVLLGEIHRSLAPQGYLYALIYAPDNPWYWQGKLRLSAKRRNLPLHRYTLSRYTDWFNLLGFKVIEVETIGCPWWRGFKSFQRKSQMNKAWLSAPIAYMLKVQKKVSTMTPIRSLEEKLSVAMAGKLANISTKQLDQANN